MCPEAYSRLCQEAKSTQKTLRPYILQYVAFRPCVCTHAQRREAFEEVNLPLAPHPHIHHLAVLDPVMTILPLNAHMRNHIVVIRELRRSSRRGQLSNSCGLLRLGSQRHRVPAAQPGRGGSDIYASSEGVSRGQGVGRRRGGAGSAGRRMVAAQRRASREYARSYEECR